MIIFLLDDKPQDLLESQNEIAVLFPHETIQIATSPQQLMDHALLLQRNGQAPRYLFAETEIAGESGIEFAKKLRAIFPSLCVIFCTDHPEYALDAWRMHAQGYIMKPVTSSEVQQTLGAMHITRHTTSAGTACRVHMHTFGPFEVFVDDKPIHFERSRAKELLAYLVDRRGGAVTNADIAGALWEDENTNDSAQKDYVRKLVSSMRKSLREAGVEDIIIRERNQLRIDTTKISCDLYDYLNGDIFAINSYLGEYMASYSWAEVTNGVLDTREP